MPGIVTTQAWGRIIPRALWRALVPDTRSLIALACPIVTLVLTAGAGTSQAGALARVVQREGSSDSVSTFPAGEGEHGRSAVMALLAGLDTAVRYRVREHHLRVPESSNGLSAWAGSTSLRTVLENGLTCVDWDAVRALSDSVRAHVGAMVKSGGAASEVESWFVESVIHALPAERIVLQRERRIRGDSDFPLVQALRTPEVCLAHHVDRGSAVGDQVYASDPKRGPNPSIPDPRRILQLVPISPSSRKHLSEASWFSVPRAPENAVLFEVRPVTRNRPSLRFLCDAKSLVLRAFAYRDPSEPLELLIFLTYADVSGQTSGGTALCWLGSVLAVRAGSHPKLEFYEIEDVSFDPSGIERSLNLWRAATLIDRRLEPASQYTSMGSYPEGLRELVSFGNQADPSAAVAESEPAESGDRPGRDLRWLLGASLVVVGLVLVRGGGS